MAANKKRYLDEAYSTPHDSAEIARANPRPRAIKKQFVDSLLQSQPLNKTGLALRNILARQDVAHDKLSVLGYDSARHLQAEGISLSEIADDLDMSVLDLMSYMALHPQAEEHAELDSLACADAKMRKYLKRLEEKKFLTKFDGDKARLELEATLQFCKRLSAQWAGVVQKIQDQQLLANNVGINITMDFTGDLSSLPNKTHHKDDPKIINSPIVEQISHEPPVPVYDDPLMDGDQPVRDPHAAS